MVKVEGGRDRWQLLSDELELTHDVSVRKLVFFKKWVSVQQHALICV